MQPSSLAASVTLRASDGSRIEALVNEPIHGPLIGGVILVHGFARGPEALDAWAGALAMSGAQVIRPRVRSFRRRKGLNDPDHVALVGRACLERLTSIVSPGSRVVVAGHSAGGAAAVRMAQECAADTIAGVVLVDPNESLHPMLAPGLAELADVPMLAIGADPGRCNRENLGPRLLAEARPGVVVGGRVVGGAHCAIERERADLVCRRLCGSGTEAAGEHLFALAVAAVKALLVPTDADSHARLPGGERWAQDVGASRVVPFVTT